MVTIEDISNKCFELSAKHGLGVEGTKDFMGLALLTIQHCQDRIKQPVASSPYEKPWGGSN
jgi:hypothetical protein